MRNHKGSVVVQSCRGMLRLQLPRFLFSGQQKHLYLGLPDKPIYRQAAEAKALAIAADIAFDRFDYSLERYQSNKQKDDSPPLRDLWNKYTIEKSKTLAYSTIEREFKRVERHIEKFPSQHLRDARRIRKYLLSSVSVSTAKRVLSYLYSCCQWAVDEEIINTNPFKDLPKISDKKNKDINPFTKQERDLIIKSFESNTYYSYYKPFICFLFLTGCRTSEAIGLQWKHVSPDLSVITFSEAVVYNRRKLTTKTNKIRKFPINQSLRFLLESIQPLPYEPEQLVFLSPEGKTIDAHNFLNRGWSKVLEKLPIQYRSLYNTRHTFITLCLEAGISVNQVAQWVGNSPETIWRHYAGLINREEVPEL